ncbi:MAG: hypothetical protein EU543_03720 [Promethearchaeota archaeon]|nr:MAG: hypothetical protein EU543_03720 [Candidatus Lokiarchaeota archaeon]
MKIQKLIKKVLLVLFFMLILPFFFPSLHNSGARIMDSSIEKNNLKINSIGYDNATIISDGYNGTYWNSATSEDPSVAVDNNGIIHVVWQDGTDGVWGTDYEIMYVNYSSSEGWSNVTVISDGYGGSYWNDGYSSDPAIAIDSQNKIHVIWEDDTEGVWGTDYEIMYVNYTSSEGWSNVTVISDGYNGIYWNDDYSYDASIAVDTGDNVHVVWYDYTEGIWGSDTEVMYVKYTEGIGWSNATVISDGYNGIYWNDAASIHPKISADNSDLHVVWDDQTDGVWGSDYEIMYAKYTEELGWSNATVISDGYGGIYWNDGYSEYPAIASKDGEVQVVWQDNTFGVWGSDYEIMNVKYHPSSGWSNLTVISDGYAGNYWNDGYSYYPEIVTDYNGNFHVVWQDNTEGIWGTDAEIIYANYTSLHGWSNVSVISDGYGGIYWNNGLSRYPDLCVGQDSLYVVWQDGTDGVWGTDYEIMFTELDIPPPQVSGQAIPLGAYFLIPLSICVLGLAYYTKRRL